MDLDPATPQELMDELRKRGFDPRAIALADVDELANELKGRGTAFVSGIFIVDEDTMAAGDDGKIGIIHEGEPVTQMRLACRVFHDTGAELVAEGYLTMEILKAIVSQELGDMFEFEGDDDDDEPTDESDEDDE